MASNFFYFISSLPMLQFGGKAPWTYQDFLESSRVSLAAGEVAILESLTLDGQSDQEEALPVLSQWNVRETQLRNALVVARAKVRKQDGGRWQRPCAGFSPWIAKRVEEIAGLPNVWEKELALDQLRWQLLDELETGHQFDFHNTVVYALRLLLLEKQLQRSGKAGRDLVRKLSEVGQQQAESQRMDVE